MSDKQRLSVLIREYIARRRSAKATKGESALASAPSPFPVQGRIQEILLVSDRGSELPPLLQSIETMQELKILRDGRIDFTGYGMMDVEGPRCFREKQRRLEPQPTQWLFSRFEACFGDGFECTEQSGPGSWTLRITNTEGQVFGLSGSLCCHFEVENADLSDLLRSFTGIENLLAFDGNNECDAVARIQIEYRRCMQYELPAQTPGGNVAYGTSVYLEGLCLDGLEDTIEYTQNFDNECRVSRTYRLESEVMALLDELDLSGLFASIRGNPADAVDTPLESKDYKISLYTWHGQRRVIEGSFDRHGLPDDWAEFAQGVLSIIKPFDSYELLDSSIFGKAKRRASDYIVCSVAFDDYGPTYYYLADDDRFAVGDRVLVPVGRNKRETVATIEEIEYFGEENLPFPLERLKHIVGKQGQDALEKG